MTSRDPTDRPTVEEVLDQEWFRINSATSSPTLDAELKLRDAMAKIEALEQENHNLRAKLASLENNL